jgi:hypothetical protein
VWLSPERLAMAKVALGTSAWLSFLITSLALSSGSARAQDASDLDIGKLVNEGEDIAKQDQDADQQVRQVSTEGEKVHGEQATVGTDLVNWNQQAQDFNARCGHPFYVGQEADVARCQAEYDNRLSSVKDLLKRQKTLSESEENWKKRKDEADKHKADLVLKMQAWRLRMKVLSAIAGTKSCVSSVDQGASHLELVQLVHAYQHCWDGAGNAPAIDLTNNVKRGGATPNVPGR